MLNTVYLITPLDLFKLKVGMCCSKRREHCGKRRKFWLPAFSFFSIVSLKAVFFRAVNPLPHMPILDSSNSATNKDMMSRILTSFSLSRYNFLIE